FAAFPGGAVVGVVFVRVDAASPAELFGLYGDRRGEACGGGFAKDADSAVVVGIGAGRGPCVVGGAGGQALKAFFAEIGCHPKAELGVAVNELFGHVGLDRVHIGREELACAVGALLMDVEDDLGVPDVVDLVDGELGLDLGKGIPV